MNERDSRRAFLTIAGASAVLAACRQDHARADPGPASSAGAPSPSTAASAAAPKQTEDDDVGAVEDLMREHGVIRRVLVVYREAATKLHAKAASVPLEALQQGAKLIRNFGEDYHEKQLEEAHIFPATTKQVAALGPTINTLVAQHQRGRDITDYILAVTQKPLSAHAVDPLARTLEAFTRMYELHTALEDTIVFPAWKKLLSPKELDEMGDRFEDIEKRTFGKDGFDDAVSQVDAIEKAIGIDLAGLTAPPPPKA